MTFDLLTQLAISIHYDWQHWIEAFCVCRACRRSTVFVLSQKEIGDTEVVKKGLSQFSKAVNLVMNVESYISLKDVGTQKPPEYLPNNIDAAFREGAACVAISCFNAAGTMFRLCADLATRAMLPEGEVEGLNAKVRRDLGLRLPWLFDNGVLPQSLRDLSSCIKEDGNDGAHQGTLSREDAGDILDFAYVLLERIYTEPKRIALAGERRTARRREKS
jgi:hypothetical protein